MIEVAENIFAFINDNGAANSGFILTRDSVIVVDSTFFPSKAREILKDIRILTHKKIKYLINTHYHANHIFGNVVFEDATIVASELTKEFLEKLKDNFVSIYAVKYPDIKNDLKDVKVLTPTLTFKNSKTFNFKNKTVRIMRMGGHSPDSSIVHIMPDNVIFAGDLIYSGLHPHITQDSNIREWKTALRKIKALNPSFIVPGHGELCGVEEVDKTLEYFEILEKKIREIMRGKDARIMYDLENNDLFSKRGFEELFVENVKFFVRKMA